ncbi:MAG: ATP-binding protein, partial [Planctomycetes bacterium]|nr:ATP-binding protein [Planctomycetota bacterium]
MSVLLTEIERFEGLAVLATNLPHVLDPALDRRILVRVRFPEPDREAREAIWRGLLPPTVPLAPDVNLAALAERHELAGGYIKNAVLIAAAHAIHAAAGQGAQLTHAMLEAAAEEQRSRGTDDHEPAPEVPRVRLADVVLPADARASVEELIAMARSRRTVLERWALGSHLSHGKGLTALFHGAPGTGKTLCAHAVAGELRRPLVSGSIPALLSPWVGESERLIAALFARARKLGGVLFLDEADALLSDRARAGAARHEVSAVNVLLGEIERFDGVVLLATNLAGRLDRALHRRLTFCVELRAPDAA